MYFDFRVEKSVMISTNLDQFCTFDILCNYYFNKTRYDHAESKVPVGLECEGIWTSPRQAVTLEDTDNGVMWET